MQRRQIHRPCSGVDDVDVNHLLVHANLSHVDGDLPQLLVQSEFPTSTNVLTRRIEGRTDTHTGKTEALYRQMVRV